VLTLFSTPVIYLSFDRLAARLHARFPAEPEEIGPVGALS
jgi:hypothetical protein